MYLVSIITPSYNSEKTIGKTIDSILNQDYPNWELLITDDNSNDNTVEIVSEYKDPRIKLTVLNRNVGAGAARNISIKKAKGKYLAFCDSDDFWDRNKLSFQIGYMIKNNTPFSYSNYREIDENGRVLKEKISPKIISYNKLLVRNYIGCLTVILDRTEIENIKMSSLRKRQDWLLWLTILRNNKIEASNCEKCLATYTNRKGSISSNKFEMLVYHYVMYNKGLGYNYFKSSILLIRNILSYLK